MKKLSLKTKLILLTTGINLSLGAVTFFLNKYMEHQSESTVLDKIQADAAQLSDAVTAQFYERYGDVQAFAMNNVLQGNNREPMVEYLNNMVALYGIYDLVMVVNNSGTLVAVNSKGADGKDIPSAKLYLKNFSTETWFQSTLKGEFTEDKSKAFLGTLVENPKIDPFLSEVYGEKRYANSFSTQLKDPNGKVTGVVTNRANFKWAASEFTNSYDRYAQIGITNLSLSLVDKKGNVFLEIDGDKYKKGEKAEVYYDYDVIGKSNLIDEGLKAAKDLTLWKDGQTQEFNPKKKVQEDLGYSPVDGPKMVDSLGWGIIIRTNSADAMAVINKGLINAEKIFYYFFFTISVLVFLFSFWFSNSLGKTLQQIVDGLRKGTLSVLEAAAASARTASELSDGATQQASAIQETASAVDEVTAMVKKNAENSAASKVVSIEGNVFAKESKDSMDEMVNAISEIRISNEEIMQQVEEGNKQISEIVKVISEIETKTKVINDIVFQTKLLSFNASVEAARAGEHGKGFAVVAEEVGNLAQMSGNAAKEISTMLEASIQKVESIVDNTRTRVERLIQNGKIKVDSGTQIAHRCSEGLQNIVGSVEKIDGMVTEISVASAEQATGASEIQKAINQLDSVTQKNSVIAQQSSHSSSLLRKEAEAITEVVEQLTLLLTGTTNVSFGELDRNQNAVDEEYSFEKRTTATNKSNQSFKRSA